MTSRSLPASFRLGMLWGGNPSVLWSAFQEEFLLGDSGLHSDVVFLCFEQKWPSALLVVGIQPILPLSSTGAWQHTLLGSVALGFPQASAGHSSWASCPAAAPSSLWVGRDERHNLSCSQTGEVIIFLQPALEAESQWVWFKPWFLTQGNFERCEVKKDPQLSLPP